jgi:hydrogenase expression/formation protein HypE
MNDFVTLNHGSGGKLAQELIRKIFVKQFGMAESLTDSAILIESESVFAFTTDSYVVDPLFFPGGNIGKLAVCGTVNDLAVSGAIPRYIAASFIIEEGFRTDLLSDIAGSMAAEALNAGVKIITGDTKVVDKGKCDKLFITTSGIGVLNTGRKNISYAEQVKPGDKLIINGALGNHAIAVLGARNKLSFNTPVLSDCASLNHLVRSVMDNCNEIHFMRDLTRGGLATVLNELSGMIGLSLEVNESSVPVDEPVKGVCEILGFDPLYLANEGKILIVAGINEHKKVLEILRSNPLGKNSEVIGEVLQGTRNKVILNTVVGGRRILEMPSGLQLPRIC